MGKTDAEVELARLGWLALALTPGMGPTRTAKAVHGLGGAERVFEASLTELEAAGMPARSVQFVGDGRAKAAAVDEMERVAKAGGRLLTREDVAARGEVSLGLYPERLLEIFDPPAVLWIRGDAAVLDRPGIAVVGTRQPSPYGAGMAEVLSRDLANRGMVIQSGMARGVDTVAHKAAIKAGGKTVAVWGTGIDVVYPKENKRLAEEIVETGGTIVSEYPLGTFPAPQNFPIRNRILSGMSVGVLVIEAGEYSGTRITARCAIDQGRDVYAVPGNVTNKNSWGPNTLIKQGARLTATWEDIWEDLPSQIRLQLEDELEAKKGAGGGAVESKVSGIASLFNEKASGEAQLPKHEQLVMDRLRHDEPMQLDELIEGLEGEMGSPEIFAALFELEMAGRAKQLPGKNYVRCF
jgi:DNA processing protein